MADKVKKQPKNNNNNEKNQKKPSTQGKQPNDKGKKYYKKKNMKKIKVKNPQPLTLLTAGPSSSQMGISTVDITATFCPDAFNTAFLGLMSLFASREAALNDLVYSAYAATQQNLFQVLNGEIAPIKQNLVYVTAILNCLSPKSIKTVAGEYRFKWNNVSYNGPPPKQITIRGCSYNFYKPSGIDPISTPQPCTPMVNGSIDQSYADYQTALNFITENRSLLNVDDVAKIKIFNRDVSAFGRSSPYIGAGGCESGSAYSSTENELPGSAMSVLSVFSTFTPVSTRTATFLKNGSGDACSAFSLAFTKDVELRHYRTCHPIRYKFIDCAEIYEMYVTWLAASLTKASNIGGIPPQYTAPIPQGAFIGAFLQSLRAYFVVSQSMSQFITYDTNGQFFEPLRMGPNCAPKLGEGLMFPIPLAESIRFLQTKIAENKEELRFNDKNAVIFVPVLGLNRQTNVWSNPEWENPQAGGPTPLFAPDPFAASINWIDGVNSNNTVYNMNSKYFSGAVTAINSLIGALTTFCGPTTYLAGSSNVNALMLTRFYNVVEDNINDYVNYPEWMKLPTGIRRRKVIRTNSKKGELKEEIIIEKTGGGSSELYHQQTTCVVSGTPISNELYNLLPYLIIPSMIINEDGVLTPETIAKQKVMISYRERNQVVFQSDSDTSANPMNRGSQIAICGDLLAPGLAKNYTTEWARIVTIASDNGKGGFLQEILTGASSIAGVFGL